MDNTTLLSTKLQRTLEALFVNKHVLQDDTLLNKFQCLLEELLNLTDGSDSVAQAVNAIPWIQALFDNWRSMDHSVVVLGLNIIGILAQKIHLNCDKKALAEFIQSLVLQSKARLRRSNLQLLHMLTKTNTASALIPAGAFDLVLESLSDYSRSVVRVAEVILADLLTKSLLNSNSDLHPSTTTAGQPNSEKSHITKAIDYLMNCLKLAPGNLKATGQVIVVLNLFYEMCTTSPHVMPRLKSTTQLEFIVLELIEKEGNTNICSSCCNLLFLLASWNFHNGVPHEWTTVVEILLRKQQFLCVINFAAFTIERLSASLIKIPQALKMIMLTPLVLSTWEFSQKLPWSTNLPDWSSNLSALSQENKMLLFYKLNGCALSHLNKMHSSFESVTERFTMVNILMYILMDYDEHRLFFPAEERNATIDALLEILDSWGNIWFQSLTKSDHTLLLSDSINILESYYTSYYASQISMMTKVMKMVQVIFRNCQNQLFSNWELIGRKLTIVIEKRCHYLQWEIRDSAYETLAEIAKIAKGHVFLQNWLEETGVLSLTLVALGDTKGYVRASALHVLENIPEIVFSDQRVPSSKDAPEIVCSCAEKNHMLTLWHKPVSQTEPVQTVIRILLQDSEGIARKAAVTTLFSWYRDSCIWDNMLGALYKSMVIASKDVNWEVKLIAIEFWNFLIIQVHSEGTDQPVCSQQHSTSAHLEFLRSAGFYDAAISLARDEDVTVQRKMGETLKRLKDLLPAKFRTSRAVTSDSIYARTTIDDDEAEHQEMVDATLSNDIEQVLNRRDSAIVEGAKISSSSSQSDLSELVLQHHYICNKVTTMEFMNWLENLDVQALLKQSIAATAFYNSNLESLLDEILKT